jgi:hypothetical protein
VIGLCYAETEFVFGSCNVVHQDGKRKILAQGGKLMERYLLFNSGCSLCTKLAEDIELESEGQLIARSLHDPAMQILLKKADPNWRWQPTLLEIDAEDIKITTGLALTTKIVQELGLRRAWRIVKLLNEAGEGSTGKNQERRQFLKQSGALLAALPLLGLPKLDKGFLLSEERSQDWQIYRDRDFGFTLKYPQDWYAEVKEQQPTPLIDDEAILKRVVLSSSPALVYLDIWQTKGKGLAEWLAWYKETRLVDQMLTTTNATVAGQPATMFLQNCQRDLMLTYFQDGEYVYRLMNWMTGEPTHLNAYWHILGTFNLPTADSLTTTEIPLWIKQEGVNSAKRSTGMLLVDNCCGHNSPGNPFPCCGCPQCCACEQEGNCTWWCFDKYNGVPFSGDAQYWWGQAADHPSWVQSSLPLVGGMSIACWGGNPGHVAHAANWSGSGNVSITEMSWCQSCDSSRSIAASNPSQGWIHTIYT